MSKLSIYLDDEESEPTTTHTKPILQHYYETLARFSLNLSKDEQEQVIRTLRETEDETVQDDCRDKICRANVKLVYKIAKNYSYNEESLMEYISAGNLGLLKAIEKYKFGKAPFPNYASYWIKQKILHELYSNTPLKVPIWRIKHFIKLKLTAKNEEATTGDIPSNQRLADLTGIPIKNVIDLRSDPYLTKILDRASHDEEFPIYNIYDESTTQFPELQNSLEDPEVENLRDIINSALEYISNEQKFILKAYYGLLDGNTKKLHQIASVLGRTPERIRQIRNESLEVLKGLLEEAGVDEDY